MSAAERLRQLDREATPGPWTLDLEGTKVATARAIAKVGNRRQVPAHFGNGAHSTTVESRHADARLVVALRNAAPALIRYLEWGESFADGQLPPAIDSARRAALAAVTAALEAPK